MKPINILPLAVLIADSADFLVLSTVVARVSTEIAKEKHKECKL